jgi:DNA/RNA-binding domain of Phe-tRNA-synthetase-like protein
MLQVEPHPLLLPGAFVTSFPEPLGELESPLWLTDLLRLEAEAPVARSDEIRVLVRDLLRSGGYKPAGRGKPASEYLVRAADEGALGSINIAVDACNAVSLHSGLPISVVDKDKTRAPLRIATGGPDEGYEFNKSGQVIKIEGLVCLYDADGPCANGVKDSQRTKTGDGTVRVLSLVWGSVELADHTESTVAWYRELLERAGANTWPVTLA